MAKAIMIQGTMSNVGKSVLVAGLCRIFRQDGYRVAPFKSQNMALNSYITMDGYEIGRAQAMQAFAAGEEPSVYMNPILLKPMTDMGSQVIVKGEVQGNLYAMDYYKQKLSYLPIIKECYDTLAESHDVIVIEGAGSPAELNLKADDIVNMGMAKLVDAPVLLVGDIDRGGVFAQLIGTKLLLEEEEQQRIKGLIVNKFRGDVRIFEPGIEILQKKSGVAVLGVVPYMNLDMEDEDSLSDGLQKQGRTGSLDICVIRLPKISNYTDFQALDIEEDVSLRTVGRVSELGNPDVLILPGTKNTMQDLKWLQEQGFAQKMISLAASGTLICGICGGYQMLGNCLLDPQQVEGKETQMEGLGLLPIETIFTEEKIRENRNYCFEHLSDDFASLNGRRLHGYEIHMGQSYDRDGAVALACAKDNVFGTYVHGLFDEPDFRNEFLDIVSSKNGKKRTCKSSLSYTEYREQQFDKLAENLRASLDMEQIYDLIKS